MRTLVCTTVALLLLTIFVAAQETAPGPAQEPPQAQQPASAQFSTAEAERLLSEFRAALIGHETRRALALCDREHMLAYSDFASQITSLLDRYDAIRVRYHILQATTENNRGIAIADFTVEATPPSATDPAVRRSAQMHFTFNPAARGWKLVEVEPRDFFAKF